MNIRFLKVLGLLVLLCIAILISVYYKPGSQQNIASDSVSDWKTYKNTKHAFEFKYPETYEVLESVDQGVDGITIHPKVVNGFVGLQIVVMPNTTVDEYADKVITNAQAANIENLEVREAKFVDGKTAVKTISGNYGSNTPTVVHNLLQKDRNVFEFRFYESSIDNVEIKIFNSFKFNE